MGVTGKALFEIMINLFEKKKGEKIMKELIFDTPLFGVTLTLFSFAFGQYVFKKDTDTSIKSYDSSSGYCNFIFVHLWY